MMILVGMKEEAESFVGLSNARVLLNYTERRTPAYQTNTGRENKAPQSKVRSPKDEWKRRNNGAGWMWIASERAEGGNGVECRREQGRERETGVYTRREDGDGYREGHRTETKTGTPYGGGDRDTVRRTPDRPTVQA
jgi:hypothetical protein